MADRPINSFTSLADIDLEIQILENELSEIRLLNQNLYLVHGLTRDVLQRLQTQNSIQNNRPPPAAPAPRPNDAYNNRSNANIAAPRVTEVIRPASSNVNCTSTGCTSNGPRVCACSPNQCRHVCISQETPGYEQIVNQQGSMPSDISSSGTYGGGATTTSGSTVAHFRIYNNPTSSEHSSNSQYSYHGSSAAATGSTHPTHSHFFADSNTLPSNPSGSDYPHSSPGFQHFQAQQYQPQQYHIQYGQIGHPNNTYC